VPAITESVAVNTSSPASSSRNQAIDDVAPAVIAHQPVEPSARDSSSTA
jgi:hypothetical protein